MEKYYLASVIAGLFMSISHWVEAVGFYFRWIGGTYGLASLGYSVHVQISTISRLGTFIAFPIIGYLIDSEKSSVFILWFLLSYCIFFILLNLITIRFNNLNIYDLAFRIYAIRITKSKLVKADINSNNASYHKEYSLIVFGYISYIIIVGGLFLTYLLSSLNPDYRVTIIMLGPTITSIGTLLSTVFFDPRVSWHLDSKKNPQDMIIDVIKSRMYGAITFLLISIIYLCIDW